MATLNCSTWSIIIFLFFFSVAQSGLIEKQATYTVLAPITVRPNLLFKISATVMRLEYETMTFTTVVKRTSYDGSVTEAICNGEHTFTRPGTFDITMQTPQEMSAGNYSLVVSGYSDPSLFGQIFSNETELFYDNKQVSVFIITSKPFYNRGETVEFRVIPVRRNLLPITQSMDIRIKDPKGIVVREWFSQHTNAGGVVSLSYPLNSQFPSYSQWTIEVECLHQIYTKHFLIDEWYLPLRFINVSMPTAMLSNANGISGIAEAKWTTLKPVRGNATVRLDILSAARNEEIEPIIREMEYFTGSTEFMFSRQEMESNAGGPNSLIGKELKVTLSVQDWWINETASGSQSAIVYDKDPQVKFLEGSAMTFKPQQPFNVHIAAQYGDGSPIPPYNPNRTVHIDVEESGDFTNNRVTTQTVELSIETSVAELWLYPGEKTERFLLTARYRDIEDTRRQLVATRYWSPINSYIHITSSTVKPRVEQFINFNIITNTYVDVVYYVIVSGGNIIVSDQLEMHSRSKQLSIALSRDMVPTAKIVVYFITPTSQVITDSLNFHVESSRNSEITARINRGKEISYKNIELTLTADPLSFVAFGAMEYQMHDLGTRNGLTKEEVMQELYSYDKYSNTSIYHTWLRNGQVSGSYYSSTGTFAHDSNSTFFYAGLYIFSDANVSSVYTHCNKTKGEFPCMDGKSCYTHDNICNGNARCGLDHRDEMGCMNKTQPLILYNNEHWRTKPIRSHFAQPGFMWSEQFTKPDGRVDISFPIVNYETSWMITAFSMSAENGLTILDQPVLMDDLRPMFMRVEAPPNVKLHEHASLSIVIYNRWTEDMDVLVIVKESDDYAPINWNSANSKAVIGSGEYQVLVPVLANTERQVYIPVIMRKVGTVFVDIEASSLVGSATHSQKFKVSFDGVTEYYITNYQVDLKRANSVRAPDLYIPVKEGVVDPEARILNYVFGSPRTVIHVIGDIIGVGFAPEYNNYMTGRKLLSSPDYSCMNALFTFAMNFYTLQTTRSLSSISDEQVNAVIASLNSELQEVFTYMNLDGSFNMFRWSQEPNTWLTALAIDILSEVKGQSRDLQRHIQIPQSPLDQAALWLANQHGVTTGAVAESGIINNKFFESKIDVEVDGILVPSNVSLTALSIIALSKSTQDDEEAKTNVTNVKVFGADYIASLVDGIQDPFEMAIVTYALLLSNHNSKERAVVRLRSFNRTVSGMRYWSTGEMSTIKIKPGLGTQITLDSKEIHNLTAYSVVTTSYALLAYIQSGQSSDDIDSIQKYLQVQRMNVGGWTSTFDTLIAVQALTTLAGLDQDRSTYDMTFVFKSDQVPGWSDSVHLSVENWFVPQKVTLPSHWGSIQTYISGHGIALMQMSTEVNYEHEQLFRTPGADYFDINYSLTTSGFNHSFIHYKICPSWKGPGERSGVAIVDFTIPSGMAVPNGGTQKFCRINSKTSSIRQGEARGSQITIYFAYLDRTQNNCYEITANRKRTASNITEHHYIRVFDYFEPGIYNQTIIDRVEFTKLTACLVCGSYQCPYCPYYASSHRIAGNVYLLLLTFALLVIYNRLMNHPLITIR